MSPRLGVLFLLVAVGLACRGTGPDSTATAQGLDATPPSLAQGLPPPGEAETVRIFDRRHGTWREGALREVRSGGEFIHEGRLFRLRGQARLVEWLEDVDVSKLVEADEPFEPRVPHRTPESGDVVWVLGQDARHARLATLQPGESFAFQGRVFESKVDARTGRLLVRHTGATFSRVTRTYQRRADTQVVLSLRHAGSGGESTLTGTSEHPFFVPSLGRYVPMSGLRPGDLLLTADGSEASVVASNTRHGERDVFNFEVQHAHNYFVSAPGSEAPGVLVHNSCGDKVDDVIQETLSGRGNLTSQHTLSADEALEAGSRWVGGGSREIGKPGSGVFRSVDNTRQFRMDNNSLRGAHEPGVPHVHLETVGADGRTLVTNNHIPFLD